jgi:MoxR-like ATPase
VIPDDVKYLAVPSLAHRIIVKTEARLRGHNSEMAIGEVLSTVPVPVEDQT